MTVSSTSGSSSSSNPYSVLNGTSSSSSSSSSSSPTSASSIQNQFLTLLTTQLENQDPSNPMNNTQITSQMAEISQVTSMQTLDTTMQSMLQSQVSTQSLVAASTIGHAALVSGNTMTLSGTSGSSVYGAVNLGGAAQQLTITVKDSSGNTVDTFNVSNPQSGMNTFSWNGEDSNGNALPAGSYTFTASASNPTSSGTQAVNATTYNYETIEAVSFSSSGAPQLVLSNGQTVAMSSVQEIS